MPVNLNKSEVISKINKRINHLSSLSVENLHYVEEYHAIKGAIEELVKLKAWVIEMTED